MNLAAALPVFCWFIAMIFGVSGFVKWTLAASSAFLLVAVVGHFPLGPWCTLIFLLAPWLLIAAHRRNLKAAGLLERSQTESKERLAADAQRILSLGSTMAVTEQELARLVEVYRVSKETASALRVGALLGSAQESLGRLLPAQRLRLIDLTLEAPTVSRLKRGSDGRFLEEGKGAAAGVLEPLEQAILDQARASVQPQTVRVEPPSSGEGQAVLPVAWATLARDQQLLGILIADGLSDAAVPTLSTITHQLSLQAARIQLYEQVEALAVTDALTGVLVRGYVLKRAKEELMRSQRQGLPCTVLMVDLDRFKQKNDTYGHLVGDVVLKEVSHTLQRNLREVDLIGRYGGEEFFLLLIETRFDQALPIAQRLRQLVEIHPVRAYDELLSQTISVGLAGYPEHGKTLEALIEHADQALYEAKRLGRNQVVTWSPAMAKVSE